MSGDFDFFGPQKIYCFKNETGEARLKKSATPPGIVQRM
jgi:hypothetical protein